MRIWKTLILDNSVTAIWLKTSLADSESLGGGLLLSQSNLLLVSSGDLTGLLGNVEFNVTVGSEVWGDSTVSSVSSSSALDSSLGADVGDLALLSVETLSLSVGLEVDEETDNVSDGFLWVSTEGVVLEYLNLSLSSASTVESSEWNDSFVSENSVHVSEGTEEVHASAGSGSLVSVLEVNSLIVGSAHSS
jgi:hypothetical protein